MSILDELHSWARRWAELPERADEALNLLREVRAAMADQSQMLNEVADGLSALGPAVADLLAENARLRGEDEAESAAATRVRSEYDALAGRFQSEPSVPDVEPLPAPGDEGSTEAPTA